MIIDGWAFNIVKNFRNSWILEKEGKYYRVNKHNKKFERLDRKETFNAINNKTSE